MTGTVYLGGGGSADEEAVVWSAMLHRRPRVLYWPFALEEALLARAESWLRGALAGHAADLPLTTWTSLEAHDPAELADHDLLLVGGGNTFRLLHQVRVHGFLESTRRFVTQGGDFYGGSAGAILACDSIAIAAVYDDNDDGLTDLAGLGLVSGFALLPHAAPSTHAVARRWSATHQVPVVAVPEASGLVVVDDSVTVAGPDPVWHFTAGESRPLAAGTSVRLSLLTG